MNILVKKFVKDYENINNTQVRQRYGILSGVVGIAANIVLFLVKLLMGTISGSISIVSDAFNNLSDAGNCIITMWGLKMAAKPADKDHPFGHGRLEYLVSLLVASVIMMLGASLFKSSVEKVLNPEKTKFSWVVLAALICSICVKLWLAYFNRKIGKYINSLVMLATSKDSLNDVFATLATVIALVAGIYTNFPVDGIMGCAVSVVIVVAGFGIVRDTVDVLLGKPAEPELVDEIKKIMIEPDSVLGIHDLIIHSYGPGVIFGSVHAEVPSTIDIMVAHEVIDDLEKKVYDDMGVVLTVHMDPVVVGDPIVDRLKEKLFVILSETDDKLSFHDFRVVKGVSHTNLIFDVVIPYDATTSKEDIKAAVDKGFKDEENLIFAVINFDNQY